MVATISITYGMKLIVRDIFKWQALKEPKRVQFDKELYMIGLQPCTPYENMWLGFDNWKSSAPV
jgi:hypothetical protein